ncbi:MAG: hypothetical protein K8R87_10415 [Verrucomicrobia bacterium]|nr:hypothetical protein [Verrucomicrobiota bacterium]
MRPILARLVAAAVFFMAVSVQADQRNGYTPPPEKDPGFFNRASNNIGGFFRRVFKTDEPPQQQQPAAPRSKSRSRGPHYNLDQAPAELGDPSAPPTRLKSPPATKPKDPAITKSKTPTSSSGTEISHAQEQGKPKSKTQKVTAPDNTSGITSTETTHQPKTTRQSETATSSSNNGGVLYSNSGTATTKPAEPSAKTEAEVIPPPPKAPTESSSVLTGSKTGKVGRVKSPYAPYSELDVTGLPSGSLALDPTTQKVFRIP